MEFQTERLILRKWHSKDFDEIYSILSDADVMNLVLSGETFNQEEATEFIDRMFINYAEPQLGFRVLCKKKDQSVIGTACLINFAYGEKNDVELGIILSRNSHNQGYAQEIGQGIINHAINNLGCPGVYATTHPDNFVSQHILAKLGMILIKELETKERGTRLIFFTS